MLGDSGAPPPGASNAALTYRKWEGLTQVEDVRQGREQEETNIKQH